MNDLVLSIASFLIMLVPMILLHELGHFAAAKLVGITVLEFGLGFPPRATKLFERGGTEYTLNWLPIGGFVRPLGEDFVRPVEDELMEDDRDIAIKRGIENPKSVNEAGPWERIFFMSAGAGMNFITAILIFIITAMIGLPFSTGTTVFGVSANSAAATAGMEAGDVIIEIDGERLGPSEMLTASGVFTNYLLFHEGVEVAIGVERGDETVEVLLVPEGDLSYTTQRVLITAISPGSPAEQVGLQNGDVLIEANGQAMNTVEDAVGLGDRYAGQSIPLLIERDGERLTFELVPREDPPLNQGAMGIAITPEFTNTRLGFTYADFGSFIEYQSLPAGEAISYGFSRTWQLIRLMIETPVQIIRGNIPVEYARPVSIVGLSQIGGARLEESIENQNWLPLLDLAAFVSMALGLTNLLPIPGLDGGRILFVAIELLRGKPMDPEREGMVHLAGLFLLLGLMGIFILNDIINPFIIP